ncbi:MAG: hypothetical protein R2911_32150 [Caldilineaceae bacterium]
MTPMWQRAGVVAGQWTFQGWKRGLRISQIVIAPTVEGPFGPPKLRLGAQLLQGIDGLLQKDGATLG